MQEGSSTPGGHLKNFFRNVYTYFGGGGWVGVTVLAQAPFPKMMRPGVLNLSSVSINVVKITQDFHSLSQENQPKSRF